MLDKTSNFAKTTISPLAAGETSLTLDISTRFPDPALGNYNVVIWRSSEYANPADDPEVEIARMTAKSAGVYTITRAQEGTSDVNHNKDGEVYSVAIAITSKMIEDIENEKQDALGYTAEDSDNKSIDGTFADNSDTKYPSQKAAKTYIDGRVANAINYRGAYDASGNVYPSTGGSGTEGAILKGNAWAISVAGTLDGEAIQVGDWIIANVDTPGQTASNWDKLNTNISYVPEDQANKKTTITSSDTDYPTCKAVETGLAGKQATGSYEVTTNKKTTLTDSDTDYPTTKAVNTGLSGKQNTLGYTAENTANKKTDLTDNSDTYYPTQKAVKTAVDAKADIASPTFTGTVTLPKTTEVQDTTGDHQYVLGVSELTADRTVTLPLLTGNDTFMFKDFHKASTAEINTGTENDKYITPDALAGSNAFTKPVQQYCVEWETELAVKDGVGYIIIPDSCNGMKLISAKADVGTPGTTNASTFDIYNVTDSTSMLSSAISIASGDTAGTGTVDIAHDDVATGDIIRIDCDTLSTTKPHGLIVTLVFRLP